VSLDIAVEETRVAEKTRKETRDAGTGRFVPDGTEKRRPDTTVRETIPNRKPEPKKK
jgi:hypothetical protein